MNSVLFNARKIIIGSAAPFVVAPRLELCEGVISLAISTNTRIVVIIRMNVQLYCISPVCSAQRTAHVPAGETDRRVLLPAIPKSNPNTSKDLAKTWRINISSDIWVDRLHCRAIINTDVDRCVSFVILRPPSIGFKDRRVSGRNNNRCCCSPYKELMQHHDEEMAQQLSSESCRYSAAGRNMRKVRR